MGANDKQMPAWALPAMSWFVSFYFLSGFAARLGFPPATPITPNEAVYLAMWLFFLFLPFLKKVKIGSILELERDLQKTKDEVRHLRDQIQNNFAVMASSINMISNLSNQVTVNLPVASAVQEEKRKLEKETESTSTEEIEGIKNELRLENEDKIMALARTRIRIEYSLRSILGKRAKKRGKVGNDPLNLMGLLQLFEVFVSDYPAFKYLEVPLSYVNRVSSAAIHAQRLPPGYAEEALDMGARIIAILTDFSENGRQISAMHVSSAKANR